MRVAHNGKFCSQEFEAKLGLIVFEYGGFAL